MMGTVKWFVDKHWRPPGIMLMLGAALAVLVIARGIIDDDWKVIVLGAGIVVVNGWTYWSSERRRRAGSTAR